MRFRRGNNIVVEFILSPESMGHVRFSCAVQESMREREEYHTASVQTDAPMPLEFLGLEVYGR